MTAEEFNDLTNRVTQALLANSKMATDLRVVDSPAGVNLLPGILSGELVALSAISLKGEKGEPFKYEDFTPEQLDDLALKFEKLTSEQKNELKPTLSDFTEAEKAELMKPATDAAKEVRDKMDVISEEASRVNQDLTNDVNLLKKQAGVVISETNAAKQGAIEATEKAQSVSDHPGYIGSDYHVYTWDYVTGAYKKTETILRPEGFSIYRTYNSIDAMNAEIENVPEGKFVLINTNDVEQEDNAKLYVRGSASFEYLVDMSGAIGFTGKTPGFTVGTVTEGDVMDVTVSENGTDEDGNPLYKLNFVIRRGPQGFTPVISVGTVTTGLPGTNASAEFVPDGETEEGEPKSLLNLTIPRGDTGSVENVYQTREIDHVPDETDLGYQENGVLKSYPIGAEVYYREAPGEVTFYKLFDIVDGKAVWDEAGGGTALPGNIYLQGANYYNESVTIIKEGYINE